MSTATPMSFEDRCDIYRAQTGALQSLTSAQRRRAGKKQRHLTVISQPDRQHWLALYAAKRKNIREQHSAARAAMRTPDGRRALGTVIASAFQFRTTRNTTPGASNPSNT